MKVQAETDSSKPHAGVTMRELNSDATVKDGLTLLQDAGCYTGLTHCRRKADGQQAS